LRISPNPDSLLLENLFVLEMATIAKKSTLPFHWFQHGRTGQLLSDLGKQKTFIFYWAVVLARHLLFPFPILNRTKKLSSSHFFDYSLSLFEALGRRRVASDQTGF